MHDDLVQNNEPVGTSIHEKYEAMSEEAKEVIDEMLTFAELLTFAERPMYTGEGKNVISKKHKPHHVKKWKSKQYFLILFNWIKGEYHENNTNSSYWSV